MAAYLESKGYEKGSKIAICSKNCAWWVIADLAIWMAGHVTVPVYPTLTHETVAFILEHSETKLLFVGKLDKKPWDEMKSGVPKDMAMVSFPLKPEGDWGEEWNAAIEKSEPIKAPAAAASRSPTGSRRTPSCPSSSSRPRPRASSPASPASLSRMTSTSRARTSRTT